MQSKHQYYHKGADNQKNADITVDLKRPDVKKISKWSPEEKASLPEFIATCERVFAAFINELKKQIYNAE